jgi:hypothetical protein
MKQGRMLLALGAVLALTGTSLAAHAAAKSTSATAANVSQTAAPATPSRNAVRQFTGYVTSLDRTSITVEKRGKNPRSMVFTKDAALSLSAAVDKDVRVTVYYRDEDGHAVAQRVIAKVPTPRAAQAPQATQAPKSTKTPTPTGGGR